MTRKEYNRVVRDVSDRLFGYLIKQTGQRDLAEDLVQDAFLKLWQNRKQVAVEAAKSWLFKVATHAWINVRKKNSRVEPVDDLQLDHAVQASSSFEWKDTVEVCIRALPEVQRAVLLLRDLEGYPYKEIAQMLELSEDQVKVYLFRARKKNENVVHAQFTHGMQTIGKHNIEEWLFRDVEGQLNAEEKAQLHAFLMLHPDLFVEQEAWEESKVSETPVLYPHKEHLYRYGYLNSGWFRWGVGALLFLGTCSALESDTLQEQGGVVQPLFASIVDFEEIHEQEVSTYTASAVEGSFVEQTPLEDEKTKSFHEALEENFSGASGAHSLPGGVVQRVENWLERGQLKNWNQQSKRGAKRRSKGYDGKTLGPLGAVNLQRPLVISEGAIAEMDHAALTFSSDKFSVKGAWQRSGKNSTEIQGVSVGTRLAPHVRLTGFGQLEMEHPNWELHKFGVNTAVKWRLMEHFSLASGVQLSYKGWSFNRSVYTESKEQNEIVSAWKMDQAVNLHNQQASWMDLKLELVAHMKRLWVMGSVDHLFEPGQDLYTPNYEAELRDFRTYSLMMGTDFRRKPTSSCIVSTYTGWSLQEARQRLFMAANVQYRAFMFGGRISTDRNWIARAAWTNGPLELHYRCEAHASGLEAQLLHGIGAAFSLMPRPKP